MSIKTVTHFSFRSKPEDLRNIETIANSLRDAGQVFTTRTDVIRMCLEVVATDPARMIEESKR